MARCRILKLHTFLLALIIALTIAENSANESAERKDVRTARCEHHDHDAKPPSKWLGKFKKTKYYGPSKSQHRQKTHYGQPKAHFRPPPQYVRTQTNYNIPPFHPPAIPPPTSYPHLQNPNVLPQHNYSPVKIYSSPPQVQSFNHPAQLSLAPNEAPVHPNTNSNAPYPQDPEDFEDYSLLALVHNPLVPHSPTQVPVSPVKIYGYPSQGQHFNRPEQSPPVTNEASVSSTYNNAPSPQDLEDPKDYSSPAPANDPSVPYNLPQVPLSSVKVHGYPSQAQNFNLPPDSSASSTEAPVPSTYSNTPYRQDPLDLENPTPPVDNSPVVPDVSPASYDPPSPNHLEIPDPDLPAITFPFSTEATVNQTYSYSNASYAGNYSLPTTTPNSQDIAKTVPYSSRRPSRRPSKAPTYAPSTYSSPVTTEKTAYTSPSYSDFENPSVSSTPAFYPSPTATSYDPSTYSPPVTEAPAYFPPYFGDDFDSDSFNDPYPEPPLRKPTSYLPPKFPSYDDSPSYNPSFFKESQNFSPPVYSEEPFQKANSRPSAEIPDYYSNEDEKDAWKDDEEEESFQRGKFPRFDEFVKQMMSIGKK